MQIHVYIHNEYSQEVVSIVRNIQKTIKGMPTKAEFEAAFQEIRDAHTNLAEDITRLTDVLSTKGLTDAEETAALDELKSIATAARALADRTPETPTEPVG